MNPTGKIVDISELVDVFEAEEGSVESYTGGVGEGKTYGATKRAIEDLLKGRVVYTNWELILDDFEGDERKQPFIVFWKLITFKKRFYNIDIKKNWHYFDMEDESTWVINGYNYNNVVDFVANLSDCIVYLDEGQDIFDSYELTNMSKKKRKAITRTRHLHKTLVVISQRYQAIPPTARANVKTFYRHEKAFTLLGRYPFFKVRATSEIDNNHMPIFDYETRSFDRYFGRKSIYNAYNSWYLRGGIPKSQKVFFEAFDFSFKEKLLNLLLLLFPTLKRRKKEIVAIDSKTLGVKSKEASIKNELTSGIVRRLPIKWSNHFLGIGSIRQFVGGKLVLVEEEAQVLPF